ncbi:MAG TPA: chemotaxis protein CheA [Terriglobales bacterium]|nr:chemotaxis protein CheA [Terriglobales bacterium]
MENDFLQDPAMIQEFLVESEELLQRMDQDMVTLESTPNDADLLNRIFRALHTIKGTSGFLGFEPIVRLGHRAEDVLNDLRKGEITLTKRMMDALLSTRDQLGHMLSDIRAGGLKTYAIDNLVAELEAAQNPGGRAKNPPDVPPPPLIIQTEASDAPSKEKSSSEESASGEPIKATESVVEGGDAQRQRQAADANAGAQTMRVDVRKLDELINLVGELVLERNRLMRLSRDLNFRRLSLEDLDSALSNSAARLSFITEELQTAGLKTRMIPIDAVFRKFPRLVRDVARTVEKEVELLVSGQETEVDKTMVELIGDPLVHLVRNSLDHGLEKPDVRAASGKPRQGTIRLEARQEGDQIIIAVGDDGAGIDPERIVRKAIQRGLVTAERARGLNKREILDFIFLPGFSTAEVVNDLSGRGVGMDVVRSNLKRMNGTIELDSVLGKGTTVSLKVPLTLAILPVLLVGVSDEIYGLPLRSVLETSQIRADEIHKMEGNEVLQLRGQTLPLLRLGAMFATKINGNVDDEGQKVVILAIGDRRVALLVDHLVGQESTVIKPLGTYLHNCSSIAGATISGDGRVRLVLDPAGLLASIEHSISQPKEVLQ